MLFKLYLCKNHNKPKIVWRAQIFKENGGVFSWDNSPKEITIYLLIFLTVHVCLWPNN